MKRRDFVKNMAIVSAGTPIIINKMKLQSVGKKMFDVPKSAEDRVLVIIRLNGGNDGLSTVIPRDQYPGMSIQRSNVLVPETSVLPLTNEVGLHPVMTGMQQMYNNGTLGIIQNVGYPEQNRSHFRSMDIWSSGLINSDPATGWMGRYFEGAYPPTYPTDYPNATYMDPFAISMGYEVSSTCQGFLANWSHAVQDPATIYNLQSSGSGNDGTYYGSHIEYLKTIIDQANDFGAQINSAYNAGNSMATYPTTTLGEQLQNVAKMISGGLETKVYILNINGFDTHDSQVQAGDPTQGTHADLIKTLSDAVAAFQTDLELLGIDERVAGMTFSEFGRQIASNASYGTDHGDAAPLLLFGSCISTNIMGTNPVVGNTIVNQAGIPMEFDFRDIYASILKDWFLVPTTDIQALFEHSVTFYPVLDACAVGIEEKELTINDALIYPNPCYTNATVRFTCNNEWVKIDVYDLTGKHVRSIYDGNLNQGSHDVYMEVHDLRQGEYLVQIQKESGTVRSNLIKVN